MIAERCQERIFASADGDVTQAELDEMVALFDDPTFADVRSVFITGRGRKLLTRR